jgi:hypothetical protein
MQSFTWSATKKLLAERGVELLSAGLDECRVSIRTSTPSWPRRPI